MYNMGKFRDETLSRGGGKLMDPVRGGPKKQYDILIGRFGKEEMEIEW